MVKSVATPMWAVVVLGLGPGLLAGCKDDPKEEELPPNKPTVEKAAAICENVEERYVLRSVEFEVFDNDGVADLKKVEARVERFTDLQPLESETIELTAAEIATEEFEGPIRNRYTWERSATGPNFYCGEDGRLLDIAVRAEDVLGYSDEILIAPSAL